jgi:hypothetical protein
MFRPFVPGVAFVGGANLPWLSYGNDFGRNAWHPAGGVSRPEIRAELDLVFARLAATGAHVVRWFLLCDGRAGLCVPDDGSPETLDASVVDDLESAVTAAERQGLAILPVLLDFHWCRPSRDVSGVACGGRSAHLADPVRRALLLRHVVRPLLVRFGTRTGIAGWDLINEPEWVTFSWRTWNPVQALRPGAMADFIGEAAALVHECTDHPVTVGLACPSSIPFVKGLGLDFYQVHWYDRFEPECPLSSPPRGWGADAPTVLGEFPTRGSRWSPREIERIARTAGYAGALAWSLRALDEASDAGTAWGWLEERGRGATAARPPGSPPRAAPRDPS